MFFFCCSALACHGITSRCCMKKSFVLFLLHFFGLGRPSDHQLINSQKHSQTQSLNFISFVICVILLQDEEAHRGERKELAMLWVTTQPLSIATFATLTACNERCKIAKSKNHAKKCHNAEVLDLGQIIAGVHYRRFRKTTGNRNGRKRRNVSRLASSRLCTDVDGSGALYRAAPVTGVSFVCTGAVYSCNVNESTRIFLAVQTTIELETWNNGDLSLHLQVQWLPSIQALRSSSQVFASSLTCDCRDSLVKLWSTTNHQIMFAQSSVYEKSMRCIQCICIIFTLMITCTSCMSCMHMST